MAEDQQFFDAARNGDTTTLGVLLDAQPDKLQLRDQPYEWSLLHIAAAGGHLAAVDLLLARGLDVNTRERGDNTYAMHWAAAAGHLDVVRRLAEAGGDVVGEGDDHALEVIGWATCWDRPQVEVANVLVSRGARHHIFSAIAMGLADEVRRIVAADPAALNQRMSRNEDHRLPLQFAVARTRADLVALLLDLGADPLGVDGSGHSAVAYATTREIDRPVLQRIREMLAMELLSAERGHRPPHARPLDLLAALVLGEYEVAAELLRAESTLIAANGPDSGVLHLLAKRGDVDGVRWLIDHGADVNQQWSHWDAEVTPLHLAAAFGHADVVRQLLASGADPRIRDSKHDGDVIGWAQHFQQPQIVAILLTPSGAP
jgi:ankyrin repeat protein